MAGVSLHHKFKALLSVFWACLPTTLCMCREQCVSVWTSWSLSVVKGNGWAQGERVPTHKPFRSHVGKGECLCNNGERLATRHLTFVAVQKTVIKTLVPYTGGTTFSLLSVLRKFCAGYYWNIVSLSWNSQWRRSTCYWAKPCYWLKWTPACCPSLPLEVANLL